LKSFVWGGSRRGKHTKCEKMCFLHGQISRNLSYISKYIVKLPHMRQQLNRASFYIVAEDRANLGGKKKDPSHK